MSIYVFTGPTLPPDEASKVLPAAVYLPPAAQGSVFRAACERPQVIAVIDGLFESVPAVWHKEILWAMQQGIHVYGSASMGALRAAELAPFGMVGVGTIFEAYMSGELEDDDEVAVAHASGERGYASLSVAMVNIRATLSAAEAAGILSEQSRQNLVHVAKKMFYAERSYEALLQQSDGLTSEKERSDLERWLPGGQIDQKREDALAMLREIREFVQTNLALKSVQFAFQNTAAWERLLATEHDVPRQAQQEHSELPSRLIEDLQIADGFDSATRRMAMARFLAVRHSVQEGMEPGADEIAAAAWEFRAARGLESDKAFQDWLAANHLDSDSFLQLMEDEARLRWTQAIAENGIRAHLLDQLRVEGRYVELATRAQAKWKLLSEHGLTNPAPADAGISGDELLRWYFVDCMQRPVPQDIAAAAAEMGFADILQFKRALLREYCFRRLTSSNQHLPRRHIDTEKNERQIRERQVEAAKVVP